MKYCPNCNSTNVYMFDSDNDACKDCGKYFPAVEDIQERTFTLQDMIDCWNESGKYHSVDGFWKDSPDLIRYFKEKFNINIPKQQ